MAKTNTPKKTVSKGAVEQHEMLYQKRHFTLILIGIALMIIGYIAMSGGHMPDANTWDDDLIYGFRRTVLAPILILAGLGVQIYAVFKR